MGVGYSVGPLSKTYFFMDPSEFASEVVDPPPHWPKTDNAVFFSGGGFKLHQPSPAEILTWQGALSKEHGALIGEAVEWDENVAICEDEEMGSSSSVLMSYVAALLDEHGSVAAAGMLLGREDIASAILRLGHQALKRPGFKTRFPQLLLGAEFWLPYRRDVTFAAPDWRGNMRRYGSIFALSAELDTVRAFIRDANPPATEWTLERDFPPTVFAKAWQVSEALMRLAVIGCEQHLPMWASG